MTVMNLDKLEVWVRAKDFPAGYTVREYPEVYITHNPESTDQNH